MDPTVIRAAVQGVVPQFALRIVAVRIQGQGAANGMGGGQPCRALGLEVREQLLALLPHGIEGLSTANPVVFLGFEFALWSKEGFGSAQGKEPVGPLLFRFGPGGFECGMLWQDGRGERLPAHDGASLAIQG